MHEYRSQSDCWCCSISQDDLLPSGVIVAFPETHRGFRFRLAGLIINLKRHAGAIRNVAEVTKQRAQVTLAGGRVQFRLAVDCIEEVFQVNQFRATIWILVGLLHFFASQIVLRVTGSLDRQRTLLADEQTIG